MTVPEFFATFIVGVFFYSILSVLTCALHVRFDPYSQFSRMFRRRPFLAIVYPFAILLFCVRGAVACIYASGHGAYVTIFEYISGRRIYQKGGGYSDYGVVGRGLRTSRRITPKLRQADPSVGIVVPRQIKSDSKNTLRGMTGR
jgi:hypothetical protein